MGPKPQEVHALAKWMQLQARRAQSDYPTWNALGERGKDGLRAVATALLTDPPAVLRKAVKRAEKEA